MTNPVFIVIFRNAAFEINGVFTVNTKYLFGDISDGLFAFILKRSSKVLTLYICNRFFDF